ncbi:MAG: hypothetical protein K0Q55_1060 [Verrucomicrobia bacterium]|jgi:hypothetical protein|nr:hypothetical protein [Verrucomicrobiota bacterium]
MNTLRLWTTLAMVSVACWCGCDRPVSPPPAIKMDSKPRKPDPPLPLFDGFEGETITNFWRAGDAGSGRYAPGAVSVTTNRARSGRQSVQITVRQGDIQQEGGDGEPNERAELDSGKLLLSQERWYGFSFQIPEGFPIVSTRLVMAQWKQGGVNGGPLIAQRYRSDRHHLTIRDWKDDDGDRKEYPLPAIKPGRWNDMIYRIRLSPTKDGLVEVWMNGERVVSHRGPTSSAAGEGDVYNKVGLYRDRMAQPMTIYFDNYTVGETMEAVDPRRFDAKP